jgi:hypothetical protein
MATMTKAKARRPARRVVPMGTDEDGNQLGTVIPTAPGRDLRETNAWMVARLLADLWFDEMPLDSLKTTKEHMEHSAKERRITKPVARRFADYRLAVNLGLALLEFRRDLRKEKREKAKKANAKK